MTKRFVSRWFRTCWSTVTAGERRSRPLSFAERLRRGLALEELESRWLPSVSQVAFITTPQTLTAGDQSALITIQLEDSSGNPATSGSNITFTLSTNSTAGSFLDANGNALTGSSLTILAGKSTAGFEYLDLNVGIPTLTAAGGGFSAMQQETVSTPSTGINSISPFSNNGLVPYAGVIEDSSGNLFGTTSGGGTADAGTVFELASGSSTITTLASFNNTNGANPQAALIEDSNGNLFGTTEYGGTTGDGTVFELAKGSNTITTLVSFNGTNGDQPYAGLIEDGSGNLFGTTNGGGPNGDGTVFELPHGSSAITTLASFNGTTGNVPEGDLIEDGSGNLFGTTYEGATNNKGTVFELVKGSGTITTLYAFSGSDGANPEAGLIEDGSGNLFGTTGYGGANNYGSVFELAKGSGTITTLASFNDSNGAFPAASLIMDGSGNLYGTTNAGDTGNQGTVFDVVKGSNSITVLATFNSTNGANPTASLVRDSSGNLFGTTQDGGTNLDGNVFELANGSNTITSLASFTEPNGTGPYAGVIQDGSGNLFGTTGRGGTAGYYGTVFELAKGSSTLTTLTSFDGSNGAAPQADLVEDSSGDLFGTAVRGGTNGGGTIFEVASGSSTITTLASFNSPNYDPAGGVIMDSSGNLFGTTSAESANDYGTVFELTKGSSTITTLASFNNTNGAGPYAGLIEDDGGNLFGTTTYGGANGDGTVFELAKGSGTITTLASFNGSNGEFPLAGLIEDSSGNLFGTTQEGGSTFVSGSSQGDGTVFEVVKGSGTVTTLASFDGANGMYPAASLFEDGSGNLFGTASEGATGNNGTVFELAKGSNTISTLISFNGTDGGQPFGSVIQNASGNLLGTTASGGTYDGGTLFEVVPAIGLNLAFTSPIQTLTAGVPATVTIQLKNQYGVSVAATSAITLNLSTTSPGGEFLSGGSPVTSVTIPAGSASVSFQYEDTREGTPAIFAAATGFSTIEQKNEILAGLADHLAFTSQPSNTTAGTIINPSVGVEVLDHYGNIVQQDDTDQVTLTVASGPAGFAGGSTTTVTVTNGVAVFSNLMLDITGSYTLGESATGGLSGSNSSSFAISPAGAFKLSFGTQPANTTAGTAISPAVQVVVLDPYGNVVTGDKSDQVTLAVASGLGGFTAGSTTTITVNGGIASFSNLVLDTAGSYVLSENATGGLTGANSSSFTISPAAADHLAFSVQPANTTAGAAITPAVQVQVFDKYGNLATNDNSDQVTLSIASGPGSFASGSTTTATASAGVVTFSNLVLDMAGGYTLAQTGPGNLTGPNSASFIINPASDDHLGFGVSPGNTMAGAAITPAVTVKIFDKYGNLETADNSDQITLSVGSGPGNFTSGSTTTATVSGGLATFSNLVLDMAGSYALADTATGGISGPDSGTFTISPAGDDHLGFGVSPSNTTAGAAIAPAVTVKVFDKYGNLETGDNSDQVTLAVASGPGSFTAGSTTTATVSGGVASFNNLVLDAAGGYTLSENAGSLMGPNSGSFTVNPAAADHLTFSVQPGNTTAGGALTPAVQVQAFDKYGNLATNDNSDQVTLSIASGPGSFTSGSTTTVTVSGGVGTFGNLVLDTAGSYTLAETASGNLSGPNSGSFTVGPAPLASLSVSAPGTATAGTGFSVTVTGTDAFNNGCTGSVTLSASDGQTVSPSTVNLVNGTATVTVTLDVADSLKLTATSGSVSGTSGSITVTSAAASSLSVSAPGTATAGTGFNVTVTGSDQYGNGYDGSVTLSASDGQTVTPSTVTLVNGTGTVTVTLDKADSLKLTATSGSVSGTSGSIAVGPAALASLGVAAPSTATAGTAFSITVTGSDQYGNGYDGSVTLSASDGQTVSPSTVMLVNGTATVNVTLDKTDSVKLTATSGSISGTGGSITVSSAAASSLSVSAPATAAAGAGFSVTVTGNDQYGNGYDGSVTLTASDNQTVTPSSVTLVDGTATVTVTLDKRDSVKLSSTSGSVTGTSASITVSSAPASSLSVSAPGTATAGTAFSVTVTGSDQYGNGYDGSVTLSANDGQTVTPSTVNLVNGTDTVNVTLDKADSLTLSATSGSVSGTSGSIVVSPAAIASLSVSAPSSATAGTGFSVTVTGSDQYGNGANGTVNLTASDNQTVSPSTVTLVNGTATVSVTLDKRDSVKLTGTAGSINGTSGSITVSSAAASSLSVSAPGTATAGTAFSVTVTGSDQYGNGYDGTVTLSANDGQTVTPSTVTLVNGTGTANVTLDKTDNVELTATSGSVSGSSGSIAVTSAAASSLTVGASNTATAGTGFSVTVTGSDQYGNGYDGTVTLSASDNQTVTPSTVTLINGTATVNVTLDKADSVKLTATSGSVSATSGSITLGPAAIASLSVSAPSTATAGAGFSVTVTGSDQYGNGYDGSVTLSAGDGQTVTPSTVTLVNGTATVSVTLDRTDSVKLTATAGSVSGTSGSIAVTSAAAASLSVSAPGTATAGTGFGVTVSGTDQYGNGYDGTVTLSASDGQTVSPSTVTLVNGTATVTVTLDKTDSVKLTATSGPVSGSSGSITVSSAAASSLSVSAPGAATAGTGFSVTVTGSDQYGNGFDGTVTLSASDGQTVTPSTVTLVNGTGTATVTLDVADSLKLSAISGSVTGTSGSIMVNSGPAVSLSVSAPSKATAGTGFAITITGSDAFGNGYDRNVTLSASDGQTVSPTIVTLVNGVATLNVTLDSADSVKLSATAGTVTGTSSTITVGPAALSSLGVSAPSTATAGTGFSVTVTGSDAFGNGYNGTVTLSANDGQTVTPGTVTLVNGTATVTVTLAKADSLTLTAAAGAVTATSGSIAVGSAAVSSLNVSASGTATAGTSFSVTITGSDQYGNGYSGPVTLSASDNQTVTPSTVTLVNGTATVNVTLDLRDSVKLTAAAGSASATSNSITVSSGAAKSLSVGAPATVTAGTGFSVTVTGSDQYGNGYDGTVTLSASDGQTVTPGTVTLIDGTGTVMVTLERLDALTLTATAGPASATSGTITVTSATVSSLSVSAPATATAGTGFGVTITGTDQLGDPYSGTVALAASDGQTVTPSTVTLVNGTVTVDVTLDKAHNVTLTAMVGSISGTSGSITVVSAAAMSLHVSGPGTATAGTGFNVTVTGSDQYGNGFDGSVTLSASDGQTVTPSTVTLANGSATIAVTLDTADTVTLTAMAGSASAAATVPVGAGAASSLSFDAQPGNATAGAVLNPAVTVEVLDKFGNLVMSDNSDQVTLSVASGPGGFADGSGLTATVSHGVATFNALTLETAGSYTLSATATGGLTGPDSNSFSVSAAGPDHVAFSLQPSSSTAGTAISPSVQVEVFDAYSNLVTADSTDTVTLSLINAKTTAASLFAGNSLNVAAPVRDGIATFTNLLIDTAGTYSLQAGATNGLTSAAPSDSFTITAAAVHSFAVSPSTTEAVAGVGFNVSIRARDKYGNTVTTYAGAVTLSCSDGQGVTPGTVTLSKGTANPSMTLDTVDGSMTLTATAGSITGTSKAITVNGDTGPSTDPVAEYAFQLYVVGSGNSPQALGLVSAGMVGPLDVPSFTIFAQGDAQAQTFITNQECLLQQADNLSTGSVITTVNPLTGVDSVMKSPVGQSAFVPDDLTIIRNVPSSGAPGSVAGFALSFQPIAQADTLQSVTVTALDSNGNVVTNYTGTVTLSSDDPLFGDSVSYAFKPADQGSHTLIVSLDSAGIQSLVVADNGSGTANGQALGSDALQAPDGAAGSSNVDGLVEVTPTAATSLAISTAATSTAGSVEAITVTALDAFGNVSTSYAGTVSFSNLVTGAQIKGLPGSYTFTPADHGSHVFPVVFKTTGSQTISVYDANNATIAEVNAPVQVSKAPAKLLIKSQPPATVTAGNGFALTVEAVDSHGRIVTNFSGLVTLSLAANPGRASLGSSTAGSTVSFQAVNGVAEFVGLNLNKAAAGYSLKASCGSMTATSRAFKVTANTASQFVVISQPASKIGAGSLFSVKVAATDAYGNVVTSFTGSVTLTLASGPGGAVLGGKLTATLVKGVAAFTGLKITQAGTGYSLSASGSLGTASSNAFTVTAGRATHLAITTQPPASVTAGSAFGLVVTALDAYGNVATSFTGKVTLALASDPGLSKLTGKVTVQAVAGVITFTDLLLNNPGIRYRLKATSGMLTQETDEFSVGS